MKKAFTLLFFTALAATAVHAQRVVLKHNVLLMWCILLILA